MNGGFAAMGKILIAAGLGLAALGLVLVLASRLGVPKLPGDVVIQKKGLTVYAPFGWMLLISLILTVLLNLFWRR
ncbi:MAG: DUF2905 domain-containing protein [Myxococcaceae bacterium]|nr:DUF2905 domain-containing protein [Myxococcaceae bacterium]